jgi:acyl dehydratase
MTRTPGRLVERAVEITVDDTFEWSVILDDRNPLHADPESGARSGVGHGIVSPGPANIAHLMTLLQRSFPGAMLEHFQARFIAAVFAPGAAVARGVVDREEATAGGRRLFCSLELLAAGTVAVTAQAQIRFPER